MEALKLENKFTYLDDKDLFEIEGGVGPAIVAIPVGVKIGGYVVGGLAAVGVTLWGYLS